RLAICELVLSSKDHPTADQIYKKLKQKFPTISLATVYQTLHLLKDLGLLLELGFPDCSARFDPNISPHIHIICLKCGKIEDYETENLKEQWAKIVKDIGVEPIIQRLDLYIYCDKCKKNQ
ncbi:MAG: Fur family transcriptional regulator, partial [Candidatus Helarchaeota archaeon]